MRFPSPLLRTVAVALTLAALACGKDSTAPKESTGSTFTANVTGAFTGTVTGEAAAGIVSDGNNGSAFEIVLSNGVLATSSSGVIFARLGATMPATGSYPIADVATLDASGNITDPGTKFFGFFFSTFVGTDFSTVDFASYSGTLTISQISTTRIKGSFDVQMKSDTTVTGEPGVAPLGVRVVGSFEGPADGIPGFDRVAAARAPVLGGSLGGLRVLRLPRVPRVSALTRAR